MSKAGSVIILLALIGACYALYYLEYPWYSYVIVTGIFMAIVGKTSKPFDDKDSKKNNAQD